MSVSKVILYTSPALIAVVEGIVIVTVLVAPVLVRTAVFPYRVSSVILALLVGIVIVTEVLRLVPIVSAVPLELRSCNFIFLVPQPPSKVELDALFKFVREIVETLKYVDV